MQPIIRPFSLQGPAAEVQIYPLEVAKQTLMVLAQWCKRGAKVLAM